MLDHFLCWDQLVLEGSDRSQQGQVFAGDWGQEAASSLRLTHPDLLVL